MTASASSSRARLAEIRITVDGRDLPEPRSKAITAQRTTGGAIEYRATVDFPPGRQKALVAAMVTDELGLQSEPAALVIDRPVKARWVPSTLTDRGRRSARLSSSKRGIIHGKGQNERVHPMSDPLTIPASVLLARFVPLVSQDAELLSVLRGLAEEFLRLTAPAVPAPAVAETAVEPTIVESVAPAAPPQHIALPTAPGIEIPVGWFRRLVVAGNDLQPIEVRCRLKAEGARWAAARQRSIREGADYYTEIEPKDREIIAKAKALDDCYLWMNHSSAAIPSDLRVWEDVAGCFEAAAMAAALLRQVLEGGEDHRRFLEKAMDLSAEAQSALRVAVDMVETKADNDQNKLFHWLRQAATEEQIFIARYMRIDDPADPARWHDLQERIGELDAEIDTLRQRDKQRIKLLKKAQYHARLIADGKGTEADWRKVIDSVESLVTEGMPTSNTDFRDMLVPIVDDMPDMEVPEGFGRVLSEVDRYLATQVQPVQPVARPVSEDVQAVARTYEGKTMVIIGGDRRPNAYEALKSAFRLKELIWIATREHESTDLFLPYVARPEVAAVLLAIRWSSHSYGEVRLMCDRYGKEFFRLPAGYNPNQVAHQILQQRGAGEPSDSPPFDL